MSAITDFIEFPPPDEIVARLRDIEDSSEAILSLYDSIAERLGGRTYERSASAFILIEMIYDHEENHGGNMGYLLPRFVLTLTSDRDLALSALSAFNEIKDAIRIQGGEDDSTTSDTAPPETDSLPDPDSDPGLESEEETADTAPLDPPIVPATTSPAPETRTKVPAVAEDQLMRKLQSAQKALTDLGLGTRVSIDLTMQRPTRERVSRTLQEVSSLRSALRRFEELLSEAELQVLEAAGVLWGKDSDGES